jgi:hypothetical protein
MTIERIPLVGGSWGMMLLDTRGLSLGFSGKNP